METWVLFSLEVSSIEQSFTSEFDIYPQDFGFLIEKNNFLGTYFLVQKGIELIEIFLFIILCENETGKPNLDMVIVEQLVIAINNHRNQNTQMRMRVLKLKLQIKLKKSKFFSYCLDSIKPHTYTHVPIFC